MRSSSFAVRTTSASGVRSVPVRAVFTKERIASKTNDRADQQQKPGFSLPFFSRSASPAALNGTSGKKREEGTKVDKAEEYRRRQGFGAIISALDFAETRSKSDAQLLYDAKYGKRSTDGKMSREQYMALRRKVGGTARDYWKDWVDVKGQYVDKGYVSDESSTVVALPFLIAVVLSLFGSLAYVVAQTS